MLLNKITLKNFRQFKNGSISFATDFEKNITLVMGDNGAGKTTLSQAIQWCLYGETDFKNKDVINTEVRNEVHDTGRENSVVVTMDVQYNGKDYCIKRSQTVSAAKNGVSSAPTKLSISFTEENGNVRFVPQDDHISLIKRMLPKALAQFFFFDGERLGKMASDIEGGKSKDFKDAVEGLMGLTSIQEAVKHLGPETSKSSVLGYYKDKIDEEGDTKLKMASDTITECDSKICVKQARIEEIDEALLLYKQETEKLDDKILAASPKIELKEQCKKLSSEIDALKKDRVDKINKCFQTFENNIYAFCTAPLVKKASPVINSLQGTKSTLPKLYQDTIKAILDSKKCLCGEDLSDYTDSHYKNVLGYLDYALPKAFGTAVSELKKDGKAVTEAAISSYENIVYFITEINNLNNKIATKQSEYDDKMDLIEDTSEGEIAKARKAEIHSSEMKLSSEKGGLEKEIKALESQLQTARNNYDSLVNITNINRSLLIERAYAQALYKYFSECATNKADETRKQLEKKINEVFPRIYDGGISIGITEKYGINVKVNALLHRDENSVERNTAQNYSVVFAFITAVIAMAKENAAKAAEEDDIEKEIFQEAEGYPLVMDAPLSSFDKKRIKQICEIIPSIAKQVVFFIKDTDGDEAEKHMQSKIGKRYTINAISQLESEIV